MGKRLLTLLALTLGVLWSVTNEVSTVTGGLESTETSVAIDHSPLWAEEAHQVDGRTQRDAGDHQRDARRSRRANRGPQAKEAATVVWAQPGIDPYHTCECGEDCKCPPNACALGLCKTNYAVVVGAGWCPLCPKMQPVMDELREKGYMVIYISLDYHPEVADRFKVRALPTTIIMDDGKQQKRIVGLTTARKISGHMKTRKEQRL